MCDSSRTRGRQRFRTARRVHSLPSTLVGLVALLCVWQFLPGLTGKHGGSGKSRPGTSGTPTDNGKPFGPPAAEVLRAEEGAKMAISGASPLSWSCTPRATFEQRTEEALTLYRLDAKGHPRQLAQHPVPDGWNTHAIPGPTTYYGLVVSRANTYQIRVLDGSTELYEVPREIANWDGMRLCTGTVLAGGRLLAVYSMPTSPHDFGGRGRPVVVTILSQDGEGLTRRELYRGTSGQQRHMFSGDGTTVAVVRQDSSMTTVYSADGSKRAAFPGLRTTSISYDGNTIAGTKKGHLAIFRGTRQVAEKPWGRGVPLVERLPLCTGSLTARGPAAPRVRFRGSIPGLHVPIGQRFARALTDTGAWLGPVWLATPSPYDSFIRNSLPVDWRSPRTRTSMLSMPVAVMRSAYLIAASFLSAYSSLQRRTRWAYMSDMKSQSLWTAMPDGRATGISGSMTMLVPSSFLSPPPPLHSSLPYLPMRMISLPALSTAFTQ